MLAPQECLCQNNLGWNSSFLLLYMKGKENKGERTNKWQVETEACTFNREPNRFISVDHLQLSLYHFTSPPHLSMVVGLKVRSPVQQHRYHQEICSKCTFLVATSDLLNHSLGKETRNLYFNARFWRTLKLENQQSPVESNTLNYETQLDQEILETEWQNSTHHCGSCGGNLININPPFL